jgi:prolyl oligopeptidase PreP (S9A serine peptidase family)
MIPPVNPSSSSAAAAASSIVDPHLWLEDVLGESQLAYVEECNTRCLDDVGDPRETENYGRIKDILDSKASLVLLSI